MLQWEVQKHPQQSSSSSSSNNNSNSNSNNINIPSSNHHLLHHNKNNSSKSRRVGNPLCRLKTASPNLALARTGRAQSLRSRSHPVPCRRPQRGTQIQSPSSWTPPRPWTRFVSERTDREIVSHLKFTQLPCAHRRKSTRARRARTASCLRGSVTLRASRSGRKLPLLL